MHHTLFAASVSSLWIVALLGYGMPLSRMLDKTFHRSEINAPQWGISGLLGIIFCTGIAVLFNFVTPLSNALSAGVLGGGLFLFVLQFKKLKTISWMEFLFFGILFYYLTTLVVRSLVIYDSGLYHLPATKWIKESELLFGLANLLGRLGFNSSWWNFGALFWLPGFGQEGAFVTNVVFIFFFVLILLDEVRRRPNRPLSPSDFFVLMLLLFLSSTGRLLGYFLSGISPDPSILHLGVLVPYFALKSFFNKEDRSYHATLSFLIASFLITVKPSGVPLLGEAFLVVAWAFWRKKGWSFSGQIAIPLAIGFLILVPWAIKGFIMSGCWLHPLTLTCYPRMEWSQPLSEIQNEVHGLQLWARIPGGVPKENFVHFKWVSSWAKKFVADRIVLQNFAVGLMGLFLLLFVSKKEKIKQDLPGALYVIVMSLIALLLWFFYAPEPRYAYCYMIAISFTLLSLGLAHWPSSALFAQKYAKPTVFTFVFLVFLIKPFRFQTAPNEKETIDTWPGIPSVVPKMETTLEGVNLYTPGIGSDQCWDMPLPCTPYFDKNLKMKMKWGRKMFYFDR